MRHIFILFAFLSIGCTRNPERIIDDAAQLVAEGDPDGAAKVIRRIYDPEELSDQLSARYALTVGRIHDLKGEALTEDSLLPGAYDYYLGDGAADADRAMQATVLAAKYHWWRGDKPQAYGILEQAIEACEADGNRQAAVQMLPTLCMLAERDNDFERCERYQTHLSEIDSANTERALIYRYNIGLVKYYRNDLNAAREILSDLDKTAIRQDSAFYYTYFLRSYADIMSDAGDQATAIALQNRALEHFAGKDSSEMSFSYASLARYHLLRGELPIARRYLRQARETADATFLGDLSHAGYYRILQILTDYASTGSFNFRDWAMFVNDLQAAAEDRRKITQAKEESNRWLAERNMQQTIARQRMQIAALCMAFLFIITVAGSILFLRHRKRLLKEKTEEIETLRRLVSESQQASEQKDDRFFKKIMLQQLGVIRMAAANPTAANQELIKRMTAIADKHIDVESLLDWDDLYRTIDYIYDGFHARLQTRFGSLLNEKEIQLCCLLRANFSTKEIAIVTQQSVRTVYQRKTVVRQKLQIEEKGDIADWLSV
ncbi:MAG: hypothetical protein K2F95_00435 [Alistipes sp.]|nr:hypothetical protein [Alistipes sp.]